LTIAEPLANYQPVICFLQEGMTMHIKSKRNLELLLNDLSGLVDNYRDDHAHSNEEDCQIAHDILAQKLENFSPFTIQTQDFPNFSADFVQIAFENVSELSSEWEA
jgi:hypothetical protein